MKLSIIIVSYNVKYFLEQCLFSVQDALRNVDAEVWVVDNASSDGTVPYLEPRFPQVKFISNPANTGFAKANNKALDECRGEYVLFLNPDTILAEDTLEKSIAFMDSHSRAGALGIKMIDGSGNFLPESKRSFPSPLTSFYKLMGLSRLFPKSRTFSRYALAYLSPDKDHEVDVLSGAYMLCRRILLVPLNGFDEDFFMYGEDIDLSYRIKQEGFTNHYFSGSTIIHFKGESSRKGSTRYLKMFYKAMSIFVQKHYSSGAAIFSSWLIRLAIWIRASVSVMYFTIKNLLTGTGKARGGHPNYIVIGSVDEYREVLSVLSEAKVKPHVTIRINVHDDISPALIIRELEEQAPATIIFCKGTLSWKTIIDLLPQLPRRCYIRVHATGSSCIVGSVSRNAAGEVIAVD